MLRFRRRRRNRFKERTVYRTCLRGFAVIGKRACRIWKIRRRRRRGRTVRFSRIGRRRGRRRKVEVRTRRRREGRIIGRARRDLFRRCCRLLAGCRFCRHLRAFFCCRRARATDERRPRRGRRETVGRRRGRRETVGRWRGEAVGRRRGEAASRRERRDRARPF